MGQPQPPVVHTPVAFYVLAVIAVLLFTWVFIVAARGERPRRHHVVSWRALWWRRFAKSDAVRRRLQPLEAHAPELRQFFEVMFADDSEESR